MHSAARLLIPAILLLTGCSAPVGLADPRAFVDVDFGHVHSLEVNPADGVVYAATHYGMFRLEPTGPVPTADRYQDLMGFTVTGPDRFLGSGHPAVGVPEPTQLGLVASDDGARTWYPLSLDGEADFHSLSAAGQTVYGWNARTSRILRSDDGGATWQGGAEVATSDLDADPQHPSRVLVATDRGLMESRDGGVSLEMALAQPVRPVVLLDHVVRAGGDRRPAAVGLDAAGGVWALDGEGWVEAGRLPGVPSAFTVVAADRYLAATAGGVFESENAGRTWKLLAAAAG